MRITYNEYDAIECPYCEKKGRGNIETYIHHQKVEIFERSEDAPTKDGLHVTTTGMKMNVDTSMEENPSWRRQGIRIHFWCEVCDTKPILNLVQHKGQTFIHWEE